jgi:hypothetical protein
MPGQQDGFAYSSPVDDANAYCARTIRLRIRTFDCGKCDHAHIVTVATDPMKSVGMGRLLSGDIKAPT